MNARPFRTTLLALAVGMTLASGAAMAQDAPPPPPGAHQPGPPPGGPNGQRDRAHGFGGPLLAGVDLTDAQRSKIDAIVHGNGDAQRDHFKDAMKSHEELEALVWSGHFDEAQARRIVQPGAQAMVDIAVSQARTESEVLAVLTPAQRAQVQANRDRMRRNGPPHGGPEHGGPDHGGPDHGGPHGAPDQNGPHGPGPDQDDGR